VWIGGAKRDGARGALEPMDGFPTVQVPNHDPGVRDRLTDRLSFFSRELEPDLRTKLQLTKSPEVISGIHELLDSVRTRPSLVERIARVGLERAMKLAESLSPGDSY